jgi:Tetratricopeptide repeat
VEYAHAFASRYELVWWVASDEPATIPDSFVKLAVALELERPEDDDELRLRVHHALRQLHSWLLIFDNATSVEALRRWLPSFPISSGSLAHVIVTTRRAGFSALGLVMELDVLARPAAVELVRSRVPSVAPEVAGEIADELGFLPLALEQAAAYLDRGGLRPDAYLKLLRTRTADMLGRGKVESRAQTVATLDGRLRAGSEGEPVGVSAARDLCLSGAREHSAGFVHQACRDTLRSRGRLAITHALTGDLSRAIPLHERTLADRERVLGKDHPDTLVTRNFLANAYGLSGDLTRAIQLHEETMMDCERILGFDHPVTLWARINLAQASSLKGI